jgi:hypothetical protein
LLGGGIINRPILCACGEFIDNDIFKDYIKTSINPSTATIGHSGCGLVFNFVDQGMPKRYSSKIELKTIAMKFSKKLNLDTRITEFFLLEVDRLKSNGNLSDGEIIAKAYKKFFMNISSFKHPK